MKLSGFDKVVVVARISKSGSPMAQPGDIEGTAGIVKPGTKGINISIDTLDAEKFARITRWGRLAQVLDGIAAATAAGLKVKRV
ncbi:MAG: hypothetical protein B7Y78_09525 [Caulobacter sp. 35-67-4]|nr:MAG: hypothetical protein B7Y78_09525 [Caulobacter sp. 35-67-4]